MFFASVVVAVRRFGVDAAAKASLLDFDEALATNGWAEGPSTTEAGFHGFGKKNIGFIEDFAECSFLMFKIVRFLCSEMFENVRFFMGEVILRNQCAAIVVPSE